MSPDGAGSSPPRVGSASARLPPGPRRSGLSPCLGEPTMDLVRRGDTVVNLDLSEAYERGELETHTIVLTGQEAAEWWVLMDALVPPVVEPEPEPEPAEGSWRDRPSML